MKNKEVSLFDRINLSIKTSVSIKLLSIGILISILLIPNSMIKSLIVERQANQHEAVREVSKSWAAPVQLSGPVITVPIERTHESKVTGITVSKNYAHFLPSNLVIDGDLNPQIRKRGIYEVVVYNTKLRVGGTFDPFEVNNLITAGDKVLWNEAILSLGIPDMSGIQSDLVIKTPGKDYRMQPGIPSNIKLGLGQTDYNEYYTAEARTFSKQTGVNTKIDIEQDKGFSFQLAVDLNGTKNLSFNPVGKSTKITVRSSWKHPSFNGQFLPDSHTINEEGFVAEWSVFDLNRNYPQQWLDNAHTISNSGFGVTLFQPVDTYQQNTRSAKYAVLILFLTFITFFFVEILNKKRVHPIQYILVGLALTVFYTLLLSLSEHIGFSAAYWVAAAIIITMLSFYSKTILKSTRLAVLMFSFFSLIYGFIYVILKMEDFSLLVGSFGLLLVLGLGMYMSRQVDWYNIKGKEGLSHA